jgi:hypothetical protein
MQLIRCAQKLFKELKVKPTEELPNFGCIGGWHANLLRIDRRKCVLFTNDQTLFSFFVPVLKKPEFVHFDEVFRQNLFKCLLNERFSQYQIEKVLDEYREVKFAKTKNRSVLGSMNDLAFQIKYRVESPGGLSYLEPIALNQALNRIPFKAIDYRYSIDALRAKLTQIIA